MIHPHTELRFIREEIGYGVVATRFIPKGTITWVHDALDQKFTHKQIVHFGPLYSKILDTYTFRDTNGDYILCWDHGRFINHSFFPSCITTAYNFELAVRDILPGQELTNDYGTLNLSKPFRCLPEKGSNREIVLPDDLLSCHRAWDRQLVSAFKHFLRVAQPLECYLPQDVYETALSVARGDRKMDSIVSCFCTERSPLMNAESKPIVAR